MPIKDAFGPLVANIKGWMDLDYVKDALICGGTTFFEEMNNALVRTALKLTGTKEVIASTLHRIAFSALYYGLFKKMNKPALALVTSIVPLALVGVGIISALIKKKPEEAGMELALRLQGWRNIAQQSAGTATATATAVYRGGGRI